MDIEEHWEKVRHVRLKWHPEYELVLWDCNERHMGGPQHRCAYRLTNGTSVIFENADYGCSPFEAVDSDAALVGLLTFLTLRPGDTDCEFFNDYSPEQLAWAEAEAEELQMYAFEDALTDEDVDGPRFVDVDEEPGS